MPVDAIDKNVTHRVGGIPVCFPGLGSGPVRYLSQKEHSRSKGKGTKRDREHAETTWNLKVMN